jgi:type I restriction enzyme S subunit
MQRRVSPRVNDILLAKNGTTGVAAMVDRDVSFDIYVSLALLRPLDAVSPMFLLHFINSPLAKMQFTKRLKGVGVPNLHLEEIRQVEMPLPPLPEQRRIVAILDEAFDGIATAKANAEKNLQNARALFESHLQSVFTDAWRDGELVTLADLATDITDGDHMPPPKAQTGVPFITIGNVVKDVRRIDFTNTFMVPKEYFDALNPNKKPKIGDVLYTVTGSFGIPVLVNEQRDFCFQRHIGLVRPKPDISSEWLFYLLMSPQIVQQAYDGATGTAQKTVSLKVLRGFEVPRISLARQQAATAKFNRLATETQRLESLYQQKLTALDDLKKSLLHQAFSGQL